MTSAATCSSGRRTVTRSTSSAPIIFRRIRSARRRATTTSSAARAGSRARSRSCASPCVTRARPGGPTSASGSCGTRSECHEMAHRNARLDDGSRRLGDRGAEARAGEDAGERSARTAGAREGRACQRHRPMRRSRPRRPRPSRKKRHCRRCRRTPCRPARRRSDSTRPRKCARTFRSRSRSTSEDAWRRSALKSWMRR